MSAHAEAWAAYARDAHARKTARAWCPDNSPQIPADWLAIAQDEGRLAAHGDGSRASFEFILAAWCRLQPGLRGGSVAVLVHLFEQAQTREALRRELAEHRLRRALWPLFEARAPRAAILAAAGQANDDVLPADELDAVITWVCARATRRRRA